MTLRTVGVLPLAAQSVIPRASAQSFVEYLLNEQDAAVVYPLVDIESGTTINASPATFNGTLSGWTLQNAASPVVSDTLRAPLLNDDTSDITSAALIALLSASTEFSVLLFGKISSWADGAVRSLFHFHDASGGASVTAYEINKQATGFLRARVSFVEATGIVADTSVQSTADWFLVGLSYSDVSDFVRITFNGVQAAQESSAGLTVAGGGWDVGSIGCRDASASVMYRGNLAYLSLYARVVSAAEQLEIYNRALGL